MITLNYFSSFCFVVPAFLLLFICPMEWNKGTLYSVVYFNTHALFVCLVKSAVWLPLSLSYEQKQGELAPWWIEFEHGDVFSCICLIELYKYWMQTPDVIVDFIWCKLARKYCAVIFWGLLLHFILGYDCVACFSTAFIG